MKPLIAGNWKMHKLISDAVDWVCEVKRRLPSPLPADVVVFPPFTALRSVYDQLGDSSIALGAQNAGPESSGAFTGEVSADMLHDAGCRYVLIGHSERRSLFGETDEMVNARIRAASALNVIFCIGETGGQREQGRTREVVRRQLEEGLKGIEDTGNLIVAYEPVWAIGTGVNAEPKQAQEVHGFIRDWLNGVFGAQISAGIRILYGGSVKPDNSRALLAEKDIDGLLVGGASLNAEAFCAIIESAK